MAEWVRVASADEVGDGEMKGVEVDGVKVGVANVGGVGRGAGRGRDRHAAGVMR